jgi:hypothetical protein
LSVPAVQALFAALQAPGIGVGAIEVIAKLALEVSEGDPSVSETLILHVVLGVKGIGTVWLPSLTVFDTR